MTKNEIADYIKYLRKKHNYTQQQLADKIGIERMTIVRLEQYGNPTLETLLKIVNVFNECLNITPEGGYHDHIIQQAASKIEQVIISNLPESTRHHRYGWVYIIKLKNSESIIKIGLTKLDNPEDRLQTISNDSHPAMDLSKSEVELYYARLTSNCNYVEIEMHNIFELHRLRGEWFRVHCEEAKHMLDTVINNIDTPHLTLRRK